MSIREELVASAVQFLQDPSVASSSVENRISFLRSKNLTQEEIDTSLARAAGSPAPSGPVAASAPYPPAGPPPPSQQYYPPYPPNAWQPPPPPSRDWRDWFIMATVVGGVGYGLYTFGKRYVYPLVAPPTPEKLEQDKKSIEEQFDHAFALVEQLAKDTEELKSAEKERTEKLDKAMTELETVMSDLKSANRRRDDDAQRIREEVKSLKEVIPKALENQKQLADTRLREINGELGSLKTLVAQRVSNSFLKGPNGNIGVGRTLSSAPAPAPAPSGEAADASANAGAPTGSGSSTPAVTPSSEQPRSLAAGTFNRSTTPSLGAPAGGKAAIPAWQLAMANKSAPAEKKEEKKEEPAPAAASSS